MSEEYNYIAFPLPLIRRFFTEPSKAAADIIDYGIYRAAIGMDIETEAPYRQLTYEFIRQGAERNFPPSETRFGLVEYKGKNNIPQSIAKRLVKLMDEEGYIENLDYNGFTPESDFTEFDCKDDIEILMQTADNDEYFRQDVEEWYRLRQVQDVIGMTFDVSEHQAIKETYQRIEASFGGEKQVPVSCKTEIIQNVQEHTGTERDRARLCLYLGIRSLIGRSKIAITTGATIRGRMFGARNAEELETVLKDKRLAGIYDKWCTRWQFDNLLFELRFAKMVNKVSFGRNTIVTCELQDDEEFREAIIRRLNAASDAENRRKLIERERTSRELLREMLTSKYSSLEIPFCEAIDDG